ncbi:hypothetical protein Acsp04_10630 [Actinomadura sp. NBRC 104425]|uniref:hypothetical protein n=1 Tax=Actinomadura sp. NBRC 104425 TaxID=3032204 RepID=UPI0024A404D6|nr:hypothetical protein [Actinomadura sp. NBRC 104425]GLZ10828.1 hypothetical protein Acsp04_10630 [Actinomadura sp. NBRC 104425]
MCGSAATWTERIAPLEGGGAVRRQRALAALLARAPSPGLRRVKAVPWPGGGWRLAAPDGLRFARSLDEAVAVLTGRYGPLVVAGPGDASTAARLPEGASGHALAVWAAALRHAGFSAEITTAQFTLAVSPSDVHVVPCSGPPPEGACVAAAAGARSLAGWLEVAAGLAEGPTGPPTR